MEGTEEEVPQAGDVFYPAVEVIPPGVDLIVPEVEVIPPEVEVLAPDEVIVLVEENVGAPREEEIPTEGEGIALQNEGVATEDKEISTDEEGTAPQVEATDSQEEAIDTEEEMINPEEEGTAPEEEGTAPEEEETAPEEEGTAPEEEGTAPEEEGTAPEEEGTAPEEEGTALEEEETAPQEQVTTPQEELIDLEEEGTAPQEEMIDFEEEATAPQEQVITPQEELIDLEEEATAPQEEMIDFEEEATAPQEQVITPQEEETAPQEQVITPQEEETDPQEQVITPQEEETAPQEQVITPQEEETDPQEQMITPQEELINLEEEETAPQEELIDLEEEETAPQEELIDLEEEETAPQEELIDFEEEATAPQEELIDLEEERIGAAKDDVTPQEAVTPQNITNATIVSESEIIGSEKNEITTDKGTFVPPEEALSPKLEEAALELEVIVPAVEVTTPELEAIIPVVEVIPPELDTIVSAVEVVPLEEKAMPEEEIIGPVKEVITTPEEFTTPEEVITAPEEVILPNAAILGPDTEAIPPEAEVPIDSEATPPEAGAIPPEVGVIPPVAERSNLTSIPEKWFNNLFFYLDMNDLLRLRRTCKQLKLQSDKYLRENPDLSSEMREINETDRTFEQYNKLNLPTAHIYLNNSGPDFYRNEHIVEFVRLHASIITHLRVNHFDTCSTELELIFFLGLTNLQYLDIGCVDARNKVNPEIGEITFIPQNFENLRTLKLNEVQVATLHDCEYAWNFLYACPNLDYFRYPYFSQCTPTVAVLEMGICKLVHYVFRRENEHPQRPNLLYYDFRNHRRNALLPLDSYEEFLRTFNYYGVKWLHLNAEQHKCIEDSTEPDHDQYFRDLTMLMVSVENITSPLVTEICNLDKFVITGTSVCSFRRLSNGQLPQLEFDWPYLRIMDIIIDSERLKMNRAREQHPTSHLLAFLFSSVRRPTLQELSVRYKDFKGKVPFPYRDMTHTCENLIKITLVNWPGTNKELVFIWNALHQLEEVTLKNCSKVGNEAFVGRNRNKPAFLKLPNLRKVSLLGLDVMHGITDHIFNMVFSRLHLQEFYLQSGKPIKSITINGIRALLKGEFGKTIEKFPFQGWSLANAPPEEFNAVRKQFRSEYML